MAVVFNVILLVLFLAQQCVSEPGDSDDRTVVAGDLGKIIGLRPMTLTFSPRHFYLFHSIPYAQPTGGTNRFKPSKLRTGNLSKDPNVAFPAYNPLNACPQGGIFDLGLGENFAMDDGVNGETNLFKMFQNNQQERKMYRKANEKLAPIPGSEEDENTCLVLNINTPVIPRTEAQRQNLLPVIFFIHGGSSESFWGAPFNGFRLMSRDIVLVTINYRLGVLGAFNLGTNDAPGNAMLYDTITALKWVQRYIKYFGGDPNRVTIYGHSAGSMMATHLLLSPLAKGLFHGVIGASGSALAPWGTAEHPSIDHHLTIAEYAGCYTPTGTQEIIKPAIIQCMQQVDVNVLIDALNRYTTEHRSNGLLGFDAKVPSIQSEDITIERILIKSPYEILSNGEQNNVPLIMGAMRHDGSGAIHDMYTYYLKSKIEGPSGEEFIRNGLFPSLFRAIKVEDEFLVFQHTVGISYMGDAFHTPTFWDKLPGLIDISSVFAFKEGAYKMVEQHSKINKAYYYAFEHKGFWSIHDLRGESPIPGGVAHVDDMIYPFQAFPLLTISDIGVAYRFINHIVNFATYGDPNGLNPSIYTFPAFDIETQSFLIINATDRTGHFPRDTWPGNAYEIASPDVMPTMPMGAAMR